jgi:hypothetical protein
MKTPDSLNNVRYDNERYFKNRRSSSVTLTIMVVAATPEDERDFGVEGCG